MAALASEDLSQLGDKEDLNKAPKVTPVPSLLKAKGAGNFATSFEKNIDAILKQAIDINEARNNLHKVKSISVTHLKKSPLYTTNRIFFRLVDQLEDFAKLADASLLTGKSVEKGHFKQQLYTGLLKHLNAIVCFSEQSTIQKSLIKVEEWFHVQGEKLLAPKKSSLSPMPNYSPNRKPSQDGVPFRLAPIDNRRNTAEGVSAGIQKALLDYDYGYRTAHRDIERPGDRLEIFNRRQVSKTSGKNEQDTSRFDTTMRLADITTRAGDTSKLNDTFAKGDDFGNHSKVETTTTGTKYFNLVPEAVLAAEEQEDGKEGEEEEESTIPPEEKTYGRQRKGYLLQDGTNTALKGPGARQHFGNSNYLYYTKRGDSVETALEKKWLEARNKGVADQRAMAEFGAMMNRWSAARAKVQTATEHRMATRNLGARFLLSQQSNDRSKSRPTGSRVYFQGDDHSFSAKKSISFLDQLERPKTHAVHPGTAPERGLLSTIQRRELRTEGGTDLSKIEITENTRIDDKEEDEENSDDSDKDEETKKRTKIPAKNVSVDFGRPTRVQTSHFDYRSNTTDKRFQSPTREEVLEPSKKISEIYKQHLRLIGKMKAAEETLPVARKVFGGDGNDNFASTDRPMTCASLSIYNSMGKGSQMWERTSISNLKDRLTMKHMQREQYLEVDRIKYQAARYKVAIPTHALVKSFVVPEGLAPTDKIPLPGIGGNLPVNPFYKPRKKGKRGKKGKKKK